VAHWESHYVPPERIIRDEVDFPPEEVRHLVFVLRKKKGDRVWAVDGLGGAYEVELILVSKKEAKGRILRTERNVGESRMDVTLAAGVLKGERFDWLVEKATELGVRTLVPFLSRGTAVRPNPQRIRRWRHIALAAMKQSGRSVLPEIKDFHQLEGVVRISAGFDFRIMAHPGPGSTDLSDVFKKLTGLPKSVLLLVGPEGGFVSDEVCLLEGSGFVRVSLGPRRLRAETAGVVLTAQVMGERLTAD
jgi:16S rRNA (uracil1498-N3)-methyltransferase